MTDKEKEKYFAQLKKAGEFLDFMAAERGITTEKFFERMDIVNKYSLEQISHALTHYCFRNGPVEDMHAGPNDQLSDADMKTLNKFCNDKIFTFLTMMKNNKVAELTDIIEFGLQCGNNWDKPEYRGND
ncbi:MAG: hypothetical protein FWE16_02240 [Firmicutes bacterium]|nr:hypothetical protein [Bacillota bacterium]